MIEAVLETNKINNSQLQVKCVHALGAIFERNKIFGFTIKSYFFRGVRGKFDGIVNYSIYFEFYYLEHLFEFYLSYDQLEYYVSKDRNIIKECNLEDFWTDDVMIEKFIDRLRRDMLKLKLPLVN